MRYKILFVDEESEQQDKFMNYFEAACPEDVACSEFPLPTVEGMIDRIWSLCPDAIVTDFRLNEIKEDISYTVKYDGLELLKEIRKARENFPCFVITSFADEAVDDSEDVNIVYDKDILKSADGNAKVSFAERIIRQIDKYKSRIVEAKRTLAVLIDKRLSGEANVQDEERIIELDTFLECALGNQGSVPKELKRLSNLDRLNELIGKVDELLNRVK